MLKLLWIWAPPILTMVGIYKVSAIPTIPTLPTSDKLLHAAAYGGLCLLWVRAFARTAWRQVSAAHLLWSVLIAAGYGVTDEWHQAYVPGRMSELADWLADVTGVLTAAVLLGTWTILARNQGIG